MDDFSITMLVVLALYSLITSFKIWAISGNIKKLRKEVTVDYHRNIKLHIAFKRYCGNNELEEMLFEMTFLAYYNYYYTRKGDSFSLLESSAKTLYAESGVKLPDEFASMHDAKFKKLFIAAPVVEQKE